MKYRIAFKSKITALSSHGDWFGEATKTALEEHVKVLNRTHKDIDHWLETSDGDVEV